MLSHRGLCNCVNRGLTLVRLNSTQTVQRELWNFEVMKDVMFSRSYAPFKLRILAKIQYTIEIVCHRNSSTEFVDEDILCWCAYLQEFLIWIFLRDQLDDAQQTHDSWRTTMNAKPSQKLNLVNHITKKICSNQKSNQTLNVNINVLFINFVLLLYLLLKIIFSKGKRFWDYFLKWFGIFRG